MSFQRRIEDFVCEHCGQRVQGDGYTNHCPKCLWSRHVDVEPGDRAEDCGGMMEPVRLEGSTPAYRIVHRCVKCGTERNNNVRKEDDPAALVALSGKGISSS
ncbi:MAG: RNHCP domain-containing protein [Patescibacteria group bacterium]